MRLVGQDNRPVRTGCLTRKPFFTRYVRYHLTFPGMGSIRGRVRSGDGLIQNIRNHWLQASYRSHYSVTEAGLCAPPHVTRTSYEAAMLAQ